MRNKIIYEAFVNLIMVITPEDNPVELGRELNKAFIQLTGNYPMFYEDSRIK